MNSGWNDNPIGPNSPPAASKEPGGRGGRGLSWFDYAAWLLTLAAWYVLSIGPMFWIWRSAATAGGPSFVEAFYMPLLLLCWAFPPLGSAVNAYINWWVLS